MMFVKSNLAKKLIILLVAVIVLNFVLPNQVRADDGVAGIIFNPIMKAIAWVVGSVDLFLGMLCIDTTNFTFGNFVANLPGWDKLADGSEKYFLGPDTVFSGQIDLLNANVFESTEEIDENGMVIKEEMPLRKNIRETVAKIYVLLRNISAIIMLIGLVYTGIQILLTSNIPTKKTQYLMLLQDWIIGMVLLIFSHIIMIIIFNISDLFIDAFRSALTGSSSGATINATLMKVIFSNTSDFAEKLILMVLLGIITYQTIWFAISYFKRMLYINVLVMFAPIISVMYSFGAQTKQIYSKWIREFITVVLIQPYHIIIYYVLIIMPMSLIQATSPEFGYVVGGHPADITEQTINLFNYVYVIICILFIRPAEAYMKNLLGLNQGLAGAVSDADGRKLVKVALDSAKDIGEKWSERYDANRNYMSGKRFFTYRQNDGQIQDFEENEPNYQRNTDQEDENNSDDYSPEDAALTARMISDTIESENNSDDHSPEKATNTAEMISETIESEKERKF